jgi:beta-phosphoglucomutase-like phosphatase (HAD superfamily)
LHGYNIQWSWAEYKWLMHHHHGTVRRIAYSLGQHTGLPALEREALAVEISTTKRGLYLEKYVTTTPLRPGIATIINEAIRQGIQLAIVTQSHEAQVEALLHHHLPDTLAFFKPILGSLSGPKSDPKSPLYIRCLAELGTGPAHTLAIEDSENGLNAAVIAGLPCAVFYNDYTFGQNFSNAALVARSIEYFDLSRLTGLCLP